MSISQIVPFAPSTLGFVTSDKVRQTSGPAHSFDKGSHDRVSTIQSKAQKFW